ncbi:MAG: phage virion morphogenesis protein [Marinifilaceae bacterium]|jgi:phage gpG-like protein|nr:phage virion morphogenesis protein [Marinifilaceae bacterium]
MNEFITKIDNLTKLYPKLPKHAGVLAVNFFKDRFRQQNWINHNTKPWKARSRDINKRGILIKSGRLKRSIRVTKTTPESVEIGTDVPYAQIHNEGGTINTVVKVSTHTRDAHTRKRKGRTEKVREHTVSSHSRKVNIRIPKRQFIGKSAVLEKQISRHIQAAITKAIK